VLRQFCKAYQGGYWHFYKLGNEGIYMAPEIDEPLNLCVPGNGFQGQVSADAAGIIATLYTLNYTCHTSQSERFLNLYHLLLNYAHQHPERHNIAGAID
jgi:hypothetical protein